MKKRTPAKKKRATTPVPQYTWKPRAKTKEERYLKAMGNAHPRRRRSTTLCALSATKQCHKMALENHDMCARHLDAIGDKK